MPKPFATAIINGSIFGRETGPVEIRRSKAVRGTATCQFYAPGWRPMAFKTIEAAKAKMERHPGFQAWVA